MGRRGAEVPSHQIRQECMIGHAWHSGRDEWKVVEGLEPAAHAHVPDGNGAVDAAHGQVVGAGQLPQMPRLGIAAVGGFDDGPAMGLAAVKDAN